MPPGKALSPWARPDLQAVLTSGLPEREIAGLALSRVDLASRAGEQLVGGVSGQLAVGREARDVEVHRAADLIRVAARDQLIYELDHLRDVVSRLRVMRGRPDVELGGVLFESVRVVRSDLLRRLALQARGNQHFVLAAVERVVGEVADVGDVHHLLGLITEVLETAPQ